MDSIDKKAIVKVYLKGVDPISIRCLFSSVGNWILVYDTLGFWYCGNLFFTFPLVNLNHRLEYLGGGLVCTWSWAEVRNLSSTEKLFWWKIVVIMFTEGITIMPVIFTTKSNRQASNNEINNNSYNSTIVI